MRNPLKRPAKEAKEEKEESEEKETKEVPRETKGQEYVEREITLSLINQKLNILLDLQAQQAELLNQLAQAAEL